MLKNKIKKSIGILTMACFLATPISYVVSANITEAAPPPPPPRHKMEPPPPPQTQHKAPDWKKAPSPSQHKWKPAPKKPAPPPPSRHNRYR